ncbi:hypothetical protein TNCT_333381 [Trichonephila clavata]|uniref:Uncharacterized protein n=1 Tax=Trichonephila clavata TaxID=2740835 RepID=A0A8X6GWW3_TRICU|nr:hypothetical protein TNCT_333381 [Trichonephila clavata]
MHLLQNSETDDSLRTSSPHLIIIRSKFHFHCLPCFYRTLGVSFPTNVGEEERNWARNIDVPPFKCFSTWFQVGSRLPPVNEWVDTMEWGPFAY